MLASSFLFLEACQRADEQETEIVEASDELVSSQTEPELEITKIPRNEPIRLPM